MKKRSADTKLYLACLYCKRCRFETVEAVNKHIAKSHPGQPQIRLPMITIIPLPHTSQKRS